MADKDDIQGTTSENTNGNGRRDIMITRGELMQRTGIIGAGTGAVLFVIFGLLQGAVLGGTAGLAIAHRIFGETTLELMANELLPRIMVAASMLAGIIVAGIILVTVGACVGAAVGYLLSLAHPAVEPAKFAAQEAKGGH